jgi:hypothetical protein
MTMRAAEFAFINRSGCVPAWRELRKPFHLTRDFVRAAPYSVSAVCCNETVPETDANRRFSDDSVKRIHGPCGGETTSAALQAIAVATLLLGMTAMFEPVQAQDFSGLISHAMRAYGSYYGGGGYRHRGGRHSCRDTRDSSRHASGHHREGRSRETRNEPAPSSAEPAPQEIKAASKSSDGPNFTPAR